MPTGFLEHANITVSDPERSSALLQKLCAWHERWRGPSQLGGWTIHVGNEREYLAVYTTGEAVGQPFAKGAPLNHIGLVVDDLDAAEAIVTEAGLEPFNHMDYEPGRRFYFFDWDRIEFEIVSYSLCGSRRDRGEAQRDCVCGEAALDPQSAVNCIVPMTRGLQSWQDFPALSAASARTPQITTTAAPLHLPRPSAPPSARR